MDPLDKPIKENISVSPWPTILKYGLIGSAIMLVSTGISVSMGVQSGSYSNGSLAMGIIASIVSFAAYILIMIFAVKEHRDKKQQGFISLGKAMAVSFLSGLMMSIVSTLSSIFFFLVISPNFYQDSMAEQGLDPSILNDSSMKLVLLASTATSFVLGCLAGAVVALIISAIMKKERPYNLPPPPQMPMPPVQ